MERFLNFKKDFFFKKKKCFKSLMTTCKLNLSYLCILGHSFLQKYYKYIISF